MTFRTVLVVDDEEPLRQLLAVILRDRGYEARCVGSGEEALRELAARDYDLVLTDVRMPRLDGIALTRAILERQPGATVIVMSAYGSHEAAIEAMKAGAYDFLPKPFKPDDVLLCLRKAEERERLARENRLLRAELRGSVGVDAIVGASEALHAVLRQVRKVAPQKTTVLLTGESGTGKELVARALHDLSPRASAPFVAVNCGATLRTWRSTACSASDAPTMASTPTEPRSSARSRRFSRVSRSRSSALRRQSSTSSALKGLGRKS